MKWGAAMAATLFVTALLWQPLAAHAACAPVATGGTGWCNVQANSIPVGNGTTRFATTSAPTAGQILAFLGGVWTPTGTTTFSNGTGITATFSAGVVTITNTGVTSLGNGTGTTCTGTAPGSCSLASASAGVLGGAVAGIPTAQATSSLYGASTGGKVLGWSNTTGGIAWIATSTTAGGSSASSTLLSDINTFSGTGPDTFTTGFIGTASSTFSNTLHMNQASTTNLEMTFYVQNWPGADLGTQFNNAYAAAPNGSTFVISASSTFSVAMNMGTLNKVGTIKCSPGVVLTWTGTATSTILNANGSDHTTLLNGWGVDGCTYRGTLGAKQLAIYMGGTNGAHGAVVTDVDIQNFNHGIESGDHTWTIDINNAFLLGNNRAIWLESSLGDSGEGFRITGDTTIADCNNTPGDCFFAATNAVDGITFDGTIWDDTGPHFSDGNLNVTFLGNKWENPGFAGTGRYNYGTFDPGGFMGVTIIGGTVMSGASTLGNSPNQFFLNGAQLSIFGTSFDNNTGGAISVPAIANNYSGGTLSYYEGRDINNGTPTFSNIATSSLIIKADSFNNAFAVAGSVSGQTLLDTGTVSCTGSGALQTDGTGLISCGSVTGGTGYPFTGNATSTLLSFKGGINASSTVTFTNNKTGSPMVWNSSNGTLGIGTSTPMALLAVMATSTVGTASPNMLFVIASSTSGLASTTLFSVDSHGYVTINTKNPVGNATALTITSPDNSQFLFVNTAGEEFQVKAQDSKVRLIACSAASCNNDGSIYVDGDNSGTNLSTILSNSGAVLFGIGNNNTPAATLDVRGSSSASTPLFRVSSSTVAGSNSLNFELDSNGHLLTGGPAPTCGTGCSAVVGDDNNFRVTTGSTVTLVTVNFVKTWKNSSSANITPICTSSDESGGTTVSDASSTPTSVSMNLSASLTTKFLAVHCEASNNFTF